jgi:hypothetical protein
MTELHVSILTSGGRSMNLPNALGLPHARPKASEDDALPEAIDLSERHAFDCIRGFP